MSWSALLVLLRVAWLRVGVVLLSHQVPASLLCAWLWASKQAYHAQKAKGKGPWFVVAGCCAVRL